MTIADFTAIINQLLPEPHAGLLNGILFGTKATLSRDLYDQLIKTGTIHIIALSGMNITILTTLVNITLLRFISRRIASLLTISIIIGFILFVGISSSVIRAGIMGSIGLLAVVFGRQVWSLLSLILTVTLMLLAKPAWIGDIGFQLSVAATLGIILFGKKNTSVLKTAAEVASKNFGPSSESVSDLNRNLAVSRVEAGQNFSSSPQRWSFPFTSAFVFLWSLIEDDLRVTLAAQVFTIPLILFHFHRVSLVSPLTNILIGWIIAPVTVLGLITTLAGFVWLPMGQVGAWITWVPLQYILTSIWITSTIPFANLSW